MSFLDKHVNDERENGVVGYGGYESNGGFSVFFNLLPAHEVYPGIFRFLEDKIFFNLRKYLKVSMFISHKEMRDIMVKSLMFHVDLNDEFFDVVFAEKYMYLYKYIYESFSYFYEKNDAEKSEFWLGLFVRCFYVGIAELRSKYIETVDDPKVLFDALMNEVLINKVTDSDLSD